MMDLLLPLIRDVLEAVGLEGISVIGLVALLSIALYTHRAAAMGGSLVGTASTVGHDLKVISLTLAVLLILGVIGLHPDRAMQLVDQFGRWAGEQVGRLVPWP